MQYFGVRASMIALAIGAVSLSACGEAKDNDVAMGQIFTDCQLDAHGAMESSPLTAEKRRFTIGANVEECLKANGLQPAPSAPGDADCFEAPAPADGGKGFFKPLRKCWINTRAPKK